MSDPLPAVPDTAGEIAGRVELVDGEMVVRLRPSLARDVTTRPVHRHYPGCDCRVGRLAYAGPGTPAHRARHDQDLRYFMNPPRWSPLGWIPSQRRLRSALHHDPTWRPGIAQRQLLRP